MDAMLWLERATVTGAVALAVSAGCGNVVVDPGGTSSTTSGGTSSGTTTVTGSGPYDTCTAASDCAWGEIDHEILSPSDCPCILGCPYLPLSKTTVERRNAQYMALCKPNVDGHGNPCPVDDCVTPPALACSGGKCVAAGM